VIRGRLNKQIGAELGIHEKTVKVHRMRVMRKMGVRSVAKLVQLVARAGIQPELAEISEPVSNAAKVLRLAMSTAEFQHSSLEEPSRASLSEGSRS